MFHYFRKIKRCKINEKQQAKTVVACLCVLFVLSFLGYSPEIHKPCKVHKLDPWDKALQKYVTFLPQVNCPGRYSLLFVDDNGYLQYNSSALTQYSMTSLKCVYYAIKLEESDSKVSQGKKVKFEPPIFVPSRVFRVECKSGMTIVYDFMHVNVAWNTSEESQFKVGRETEEHLSVIYIGFDSLSGSEVERKGKLTYKYLVETLGAYHHKGAMKVGLNTHPNKVALFRGEYSKDLLYNYLSNKNYDDESFLWKDAKRQNMVTALVQDGMDFMTGRFQHPPTDYYYQENIQAMENFTPVIVEQLDNSRDCYGNKDKFLLQLNYLKRFLTKYKGRRKFAFFWSSQMTHNAAHFEQADTYLKEFIEWLKNKGHLDRSILVLGSDHGFRVGGGSGATYVGKLEINMPVLIAYFPKHLVVKYPWMHKNLLENTKKLVSHYDTYETMQGIINADFNENNDATTFLSRKGRKLYSVIPSERSCAEAGIPPNFCTCDEEFISIGTSSSFVKLLANQAIDRINGIINDGKDVCVTLNLLNVTEVKVSYQAAGNDVIYGLREFYHWIFEKDVSGRYVVEFYTERNTGFYRAVFDYDKSENETILMGDPVRMNKYGNQSHCIENSYLKQFCLCKDMQMVVKN